MSNGLQARGRVTIDETTWVLYSDGAYEHVVDSYDFDRYSEECVSADALSDHYTDWCIVALFADDETAEAVRRELGLID